MSAKGPHCIVCKRSKDEVEFLVKIPNSHLCSDCIKLASIEVTKARRRKKREDEKKLTAQQS